MTALQKKKTILFIICLLLLLPAAQFLTGFFKEEMLGGYGANATKTKPVLEKKTWLSGEYQEAYEAWYKENFGFRKTFTRFNNQLNYSLFDTSRAFDMIVGKEGYLFYRNYLVAYTGGDYTGEEYLESSAKKLKAIQDSLEARGITFLVVYAPGPPSFYPEYLPEKFSKEGEHSIYKSMIAQFNSKGVHYIDFRKWFQELKTKEPYPLITHSGTHWSCYGAALAADSLVRYTARARNMIMPRLNRTRTRVTKKLQLPDNDIYTTANLWSSYREELVAYPNWSYVVPPGKKPLKLLAVGDSYFDVLMRYTALTPACFEQLDFWSYNELIYRMDGSQPVPCEEVSAGRSMEESQVVILMATEANYGGMFWNFPDEAYAYFCEGKKELPDPAFKKARVMMMKDKGWFLSIQWQALAEKISVDSCLNRSARQAIAR